MKFDSNTLFVVYECGKIIRKRHPLILDSIIKDPLQLLHIDLYGPSLIGSMFWKKYILVIVDDHTRFTWVFFLCQKSETAKELFNCIKGIEVRIKLPV